MSTGADNWASATPVVIASDGGTYTSDETPNGSLTMETGEPMPTTYTSGKTAWWKYTPTSSGTATFSTAGTTLAGSGGSDDTEMAVYTGSAVNSLTKLASNSDTVGTKAVISGFSVTSGTTYYVQVGAYNGNPMNYVLAVTGPAAGAGTPASYASGFVSAATSTTSVAAVAHIGAGFTSAATSAFTLSGMSPTAYAAGFTAAASSTVAIGLEAADDLDGGVGFAEELPDDDLPAAEIPDPKRLIRTRAWSVPPIELDDNGRPTEAWKAGAAEFQGVWGAYQLFVGGEDVTTFRDMPFQMPTRQHANPFGYKALEVVLPGVTPWTWSQRETDPAVSGWLTPWAPVVLRLVDEAGVSTVYWRGFIGAESPQADGLHLTCAGEARGRLEMDYKTLRPFVFRKDIGVSLYDLARRPGLRITPDLGIETGIVVDERSRTQGTLLECIDELCSLSQDTNGNTVTFTPTGPNGNVYEMHYQDTETVHYTVFYGAYGISADLQSNILDHPTTLYGYGRESDGGFWANIKASGLFESAPPDFPGTLTHGDEGADVNTLKTRLEQMGYLDRQDSHDEVGFGDATEDAVKDLQDDLGHAENGIVDLATWNAAWDIDVTGTSLAQAHSEPLAQNNNTKRFNVTASGAIAGPNPDYDPLRPKVTEVTDYGVYQKRQARKRARRRRIRLAQAKAYTGTLRLDSDLFEGDYHHGDPDPVIVSRFVPLEGKNIMLRGFDGDLLLHVAEDDKDTTGASETVSSLVIPPLEVRQLVARNNEGRGNPAKTFRRTHRGSEIPGPIDFWSEIGGFIKSRQTLEGGKWNVLDEVVAGDMGTLAQVGLELEDAVEFVAVLFAVPVNQAWVRDTLPDPFAMPKAWQHTTVRQLRKTIMLEFWGDKDEPAGYGPDGSKADGDPVTGILLDQAGIPYRTFARDDINNGKRCLLYWAVHPKTDTAIGPQRCLWPNPEVGM